MRDPHHHRPDAGVGARRQQALLAEDRREREAANATRTRGQKVAPGEVHQFLDIEITFHGVGFRALLRTCGVNRGESMVPANHTNGLGSCASLV